MLEDAYLSALAAALPEGQFDHLPDTQAAQRAAIIDWRTRLTLLARRAGARLPADLQQRRARRDRALAGGKLDRRGRDRRKKSAPAAASVQYRIAL